MMRKSSYIQVIIRDDTIFNVIFCSTRVLCLVMKGIEWYIHTPKGIENNEISNTCTIPALILLQNIIIIREWYENKRLKVAKTSQTKLAF
jgi:hypothetical protein